MSSGTSEEAQLAQCQAYVQRHNIQQIVKEAIVSLCIHKPENPILFLKEHFEKLNEQRSQVIRNFLSKLFSKRTLKFLSPWKIMHN